MSSHGLLDNLVLIPIPVIVVTAVGLIRNVSTSRTSLDPRPRWRKWLAYAAIIWGAGLACGLYIDISTIIQNGWTIDWLANFMGTVLCVIIATIAMPVMVTLWGGSQLLKKVFPGLRSGGNDDDWDITAGL